jgi:Ni/Co efflux regulator RcnB
MFKTISAALLAVSVLAAPALAAAPGNPYKTAPAPPFSAKVLNANAHWGRHHRHHRHYFHYRHHRHHHWR